MISQYTQHTFVNERFSYKL